MDLRKKLIVEPGAKVNLSKWKTDSTPGVADRPAAEDRLSKDLPRLDELQYLLYAEGTQALLVVLQGMDAGGKDGAIRHVCTAMNPQGVRVTSFKVPSEEERSHDFLWRIHKEVPPNGYVGVFNRSHYEDVLVVRVHSLVSKQVWQQRYDQINQFEEMLTASSVRVVKFFLHISKEEQLARLKERLDDRNKHWKISQSDFEERRLWAKYTTAYEAALEECSQPHAPWYIIPSDHKWYRNYAIARILVETMEEMDPKLPEPKFDLSKIKVS